MDTPESRMQTWNGFPSHAQGWSNGLSLSQGSKNKKGGLSRCSRPEIMSVLVLL